MFCYIDLHGDRMTVQRTVSDGARNIGAMPKRGFLAAAVLAAGLTFGTGCKNEQTAETTASIIAMPVCEDGCTVKKGSLLAKLTKLPEEANFELRVGRVDDRGIELVSNMEMFASEHASNERNPLRIEYGEERRLGNFPLMIRAERGSVPGVALVSVGSPKPQLGF